MSRRSTPESREICVRQWKYELTTLELKGEEVLSLEEVAEKVCCSTDLLRTFVVHGLVEPAGGSRFHSSAVRRISKALRLQEDLGLNVEGTALVLDLLDRIEELEGLLGKIRR